MSVENELALHQLSSKIGIKTRANFFFQSEVKPDQKQLWITHIRFPPFTLAASNYLLRVFIGSLYCLPPLWLARVICCFWFYDSQRKTLSWLVWLVLLKIVENFVTKNDIRYRQFRDNSWEVTWLVSSCQRRIKVAFVVFDLYPIGLERENTKQYACFP